MVFAEDLTGIVIVDKKIQAEGGSVGSLIAQTPLHIIAGVRLREDLVDSGHWKRAILQQWYCPG